MSNRFLELRSSGEYIDRTFFIPSLIKNRYVTLSRPRGLGSSVFCDMLEQYFLGLRENFRGLAIASSSRATRMISDGIFSAS